MINEILLIPVCLAVIWILGIYTGWRMCQRYLYGKENRQKIVGGAKTKKGKNNGKDSVSN